MRLGDSIECSKWRTKLNAAYNKAISAIQKIRDKDGNEYVPDGNGLVTIDYSPTTINGFDSRITANTNAIATEQTARTNADTVLQSEIDAKQDALSYGSGISIINNTVRANGVLTTVSRSSAGANAYRQTVGTDGTVSTASQAIFTAGDNLTYDASTGKLDATDTKYTAGSGIDISDANVISVSGSSQSVTASDVTLDDNRTVQTAIDAIEDEIGDETTAGSIKYVEKTNTDNIATNASNISALQTSVAGKQNTLTAGEGTLIVDDTIYANDNIVNMSDSFYVVASKALSIPYTAHQVVSTLDNAPSVVSGRAYLFKLGNGLKESTDSTIAIRNPTIEVDTSVIQSKLTAGDNITIADDGTISSSASAGTAYTAGDGISISDDNVISNSGVTSLSVNASAGTTSWTGVSTANAYRMVTLSHNSVTNGLFRGYYNNYTPVASNSVANTYTSSALFIGGLILQWGWFTAYANSTSYYKAVVNFRTAYTNANHYTVLTNVWDYGSHDLWSYQSMVESKTTNSFTVHVSNGNSGTNISQDCRIMWFAIGF